MGTETAIAVAQQCIEAVGTGAAFDDIVDAALDHLAAATAPDLWSQCRGVDRALDLRRCTRSVVDLVDQHPPPPNLTAVWFGLHEATDGVGGSRSVVLLSGGTTYPDEEWLFQQDWRPDDGLETPGLSSFAQAARPYGDEAISLATYALALAYAIGLVVDLVRGEAGAVLLGERDLLAVAVGFHDGDVLQLGVLTPNEGLSISPKWI